MLRTDAVYRAAKHGFLIDRCVCEPLVAATVSGDRGTGGPAKGLESVPGPAVKPGPGTGCEARYRSLTLGGFGAALAEAFIGRAHGPWQARTSTR